MHENTKEIKTKEAPLFSMKPFRRDMVRIYGKKGTLLADTKRIPFNLAIVIPVACILSFITIIHKKDPTKMAVFFSAPSVKFPFYVMLLYSIIAIFVLLSHMPVYSTFKKYALYLANVDTYTLKQLSQEVHQTEEEVLITLQTFVRKQLLRKIYLEKATGTLYFPEFDMQNDYLADADGKIYKVPKKYTVPEIDKKTSWEMKFSENRMLAFVYLLIGLLFAFFGLKKLIFSFTDPAVILGKGTFIQLLIAVLLSFYAVKKLQLVSSFKRYITVLLQDETGSIENLAHITNEPVEQVLCRLQKMMHQKYFSEATYIDFTTYCIVFPDYDGVRISPEPTPPKAPTVFLCKNCGGENTSTNGTIKFCSFCGAPLTDANSKKEEEQAV